VEDMSEAEKAYNMFRLGIDQSMGGLRPEVLMEAYGLYVEEEGQEAADENWAKGAYQCVLPIFEVGNFENPYVEGAESLATISALVPDVTNELAQASVVMVKNTDGIIAEAGEAKNVYIANEDIGLSKKVLKNYFNVVDSADEADMVVVFVQSPQNANTGYNEEDEEWVPISLQYREYCADADAVLEDSLTGDVVTTQVESPYGLVSNTEKENRGYYDATTTVTNEADLDLILSAAESGKPVVVCVNATGAFCVDEFEADVAGILVGFGIDNSNFLPILAGQVEPSGLLPVQMPLNMEAVEEQQSGTPRDMECYVDADGNTYDFAYGLNWSGIIDDARTAKYAVDVMTGLD
jgi:beta-glucosidase